jgi:hypothetical protein
VNYRATANRMKNAVTGNIRRTALVGGAAVVMTGLVATPAVAFASDTSPAPAAVAAAHATAPTSGVKIAQAAPAAPAKAAAKPAKPAAKPAAPKPPSMQQLSSGKITAAQTMYKPNAEQMSNAKKIIAQGQKMHLPPRAWVIALATSSQETNLHNYGQLAHNDHDSLGLFQQRPSAGWGSPSQLVNPSYSAGKFYAALMQVNGWNKLPVTVAAQDVQVSAFGDRYAQWEKQAENLILATYGVGPYAGVAGAH